MADHLLLAGQLLKQRAIQATADTWMFLTLALWHLAKRKKYYIIQLQWWRLFDQWNFIFRFAPFPRGKET